MPPLEALTRTISFARSASPEIGGTAAGVEAEVLGHGHRFIEVPGEPVGVCASLAMVIP